MADAVAAGDGRAVVGADLARAADEIAADHGLRAVGGAVEVGLAVAADAVAADVRARSAVLRAVEGGLLAAAQVIAADGVPRRLFPAALLLGLAGVGAGGVRRRIDGTGRQGDRRAPAERHHDPHRTKLRFHTRPHRESLSQARAERSARRDTMQSDVTSSFVVVYPDCCSDFGTGATVRVELHGGEPLVLCAVLAQR